MRRSVRQVTEKVGKNCLGDQARWDIDDCPVDYAQLPKSMLMLRFSFSSSRMTFLRRGSVLSVFLTNAVGNFERKLACNAQESQETTVVFEYCYYLRQTLRFELRGRNSSPPDFAEVEVPSIVLSSSGTLNFTGSGNLSLDYIVEELPESKQLVSLTFCARNLCTEGLLCWCRPPTARLSLMKDGVIIRSTEWCRARNPKWAPITLSAVELITPECEPVDYHPEDHHIVSVRGSDCLRVVCHGPRGLFDSKPQVYAEWLTDAQELLSGLSSSVGTLHKGEARILLEGCSLEPMKTFVDYLRDGLKIWTLYCVDFSYYNGARSNPFSLHYAEGTWPSSYQATLTAVSLVIQTYSENAKFYFFGFGVSGSDFSVQFQDSPGICNGVTGVLNAYRASLGQLVSLGSPFMAPVLRRCVGIVRGRAKEGLKFFQVFVLTAGVVADLRESESVLIDAGNAPLSVVIVVMGSNDCQQVLELATSVRSKGGCAVSVVSFRDIFLAPCNDDNNTDLLGDEAYANRLTRSLLSSIPQRVVSFYDSREVQR